jgi:demethylmenaquinone methyltransferase/2-methoxy-6-polyprenyl-1,4-benzoquinol methylase
MTFYNKNDPQSIQKMFGSIAKQYDRTNAILSLQMHRYWNQELIKLTLLKNAPESYLDLCCGTGEISLKYLKNCPFPCTAYLLDFCPEMLFFAQERAKNLNSHHKISYLQADAQEIPLPKESIDCMTMAYGIRNIPDPNKCFREIHRVLKKEGKIGILELTQPVNPLLKAGHSLYLNTVIPLMGKLVTSNKDAYQYLCKSIKSFTQPQEMEKMLIAAGFKSVSIKPLMGGIATILVAKK